MAVATFLEANDLSGKTVAQFVTHGGGGVANCGRDLQRLCPGAKFTEVLSVGGSSGARREGGGDGVARRDRLREVAARR